MSATSHSEGVRVGAVGSALILAGVGLLASTLHAAWQARFAGPARDFWVALPMLEDFFAGRGVAAHLVAPVGFQIGLLPKLLFLVEYRAFGGENLFLMLCALAAQGLALSLLVLRIWRGRSRPAAPVAALLTAVALALLFSATQIDAFVRPFNLGWALAGVGGTLSILALVRANELRIRGAEALRVATWLAASVAAATLACASAAWGLLALPTIVLLAVGLRLPARAWLPLAAAGALLLAAYLAALPTESMEIASDPRVWLPWLAHLLGMPLSEVSAPAGATLGGVALALVALAWLRLLVFRDEREPLRAVFLGIAGYAAGSAALVALGRAAGDLAVWDASRYQTLVMLFWLGWIGLATLRAARAPRRWRAVGGAALALWIGAALVPAHLREARAARAFSERVRVAQAAILSGVDDTRAYRALLSPIVLEDLGADLAAQHVPFLRRHGLGMFAGEAAGLLGAELGRELRISRGDCEGRVLHRHRFERQRLHGIAFRGAVRVAAQRCGSRRLMASHGGRVIGIGQAGDPSALLLDESRARPGEQDWVVFVSAAHAGDPVRFWVLVGDGVACPVGASAMPGARAP